jgi:hypothetical protein
MSGELAPLIVGEIDRSWTSKRHRLDGKSAIKISLKTSDANEARSRWASIHAQIEALHRLALIQVAYRRKRDNSGLQHVGVLSDADKHAIAEQVLLHVQTAHVFLRIVPSSVVAAAMVFETVPYFRTLRWRRSSR